MAKSAWCQAMILFLHTYYSLFTEHPGLLTGYSVPRSVSCTAFGQLRNFKIKIYLLMKQYSFLLTFKDLYTAWWWLFEPKLVDLLLKQRNFLVLMNKICVDLSTCHSNPDSCVTVRLIVSTSQNNYEFFHKIAAVRSFSRLCLPPHNF